MLRSSAMAGRVGAVRVRALLVATVLLAMVLVAACGDAQREPRDRDDTRPFEPLVLFDTIPGAVLVGGDTVPITMEVADDGDRRSYGLMERPVLEPGHSMIFVYPEQQPGSSPFWMYRTEMALDIAFLDAAGEIVAILTMEPCPSPNPDVCRRYAPGVPYRGALEVPRGWFAEQGVGPGDRVLPSPADLPAAP